MKTAPAGWSSSPTARSWSGAGQRRHRPRPGSSPTATSTRRSPKARDAGLDPVDDQGSPVIADAQGRPEVNVALADRPRLRRAISSWGPGTPSIQFNGDDGTLVDFSRITFTGNTHESPRSARTVQCGHDNLRHGRSNPTGRSSWSGSGSSPARMTDTFAPTPISPAWGSPGSTRTVIDLTFGQLTNISPYLPIPTPLSQRPPRLGPPDFPIQLLDSATSAPRQANGVTLTPHGDIIVVGTRAADPGPRRPADPGQPDRNDGRRPVLRGGFIDRRSPATASCRSRRSPRAWTWSTTSWRTRSWRSAMSTCPPDPAGVRHPPDRSQRLRRLQFRHAVRHRPLQALPDGQLQPDPRQRPGTRT